jgi:serine/threonine-protein kinase
MPLQDSFSRRSDSNSASPRAPKPAKLPKPPTQEDLHFTLSRAKDSPMTPVSLQWKKGEKRIFLLSVTWEQESERGEGAWVFQSGPDANDLVVNWSLKTRDIPRIHTLITEAMASDEPLPVQQQTTTGENWQTDTQDQMETVQTEPEIAPGAIFAENYELLCEIGSGGMGVLYKARDLQADRLVAIKVLHAHLASDQMSKRRFEQEARAAITLAHPNLISVYHYGFSPGGLPFLVMEYLDATPVDQILEEHGRLDIDTFLSVFTQSCDGLSHAHEKGILHRDLKPSNIMVLQDGLVKIVDFGIAKILSSMVNTPGYNKDLTLAGDLIGSPSYMSPEQCKGLTLDLRSDIYSLGCVMYQAISGVLPFSGENALQTMGKHILETPPAFARDIYVPDKLQQIISRCLDKEPEGRYETVKALRADLEELCPNLATQAQIAPASTSASLLVETGDLPQTTLDAALKVQKLLRAGAITLTQAAEALGRAHLHGGQINVEAAAQVEPVSGVVIETPVEAILVEAGLITNGVWRTLLQLQQEVRNGEITKEEALAELKQKHPRAVAAPKQQKAEGPRTAVELLKMAGIVSEEDINLARSMGDDEAADLGKRLVGLGRLDIKIFISATQCQSLIEHGRLDPGKAIIALHYCQRSRVGFYEAVEELGWERP